MSSRPACWTSDSHNRWTTIRGPGHSYDNALAETTNGMYKTECVYGPDSTGWDDVDHLELATLSWVHWFNEHRLHSHCGDVPPAEFDSASYADQQATPTGAGTPNP